MLFSGGKLSTGKRGTCNKKAVAKLAGKHCALMVIGREGSRGNSDRSKKIRNGQSMKRSGVLGLLIKLQRLTLEG
jgi:hypothetical protein